MLLTWCRQLANRQSQAVARTHRAGARRKHEQRLQLERLESRLTPGQFPYFWIGDFGPLWGFAENWYQGNSPYGDPSAWLGFGPFGLGTPDTIHDFTGPTTIDRIVFISDGYSLSADPGASTITFTGDIFSDIGPGTSTISLPLYFSNGHVHNFETLNANDTMVLSGNGNLSGSGLIRKTGQGKLVMSGDHSSFQALITVAAGTLQLGSSNGLGNDEPIGVEQGAVLDLNNFDATLSVVDHPRGEIRLGNGNLILNGHIITIDGSITGTGGLTLTGNARIDLDGTNTFSGPTRLVSGNLEIDGSSPYSPIIVSSGTGLYGRGTTGPLRVSGLVYPGNVPGEGGIGPGVLQSDGDVTFLSGSSFGARLNGTTPGGQNGYDQLNVSGTLDLRGSPTLNAFVGFASLPGDTFTILTSTDGITGTFAGLPDGTDFGLNGTPMRIHYTRNSVILTHRPQFLPPVTYRVPGPTPGGGVAVGDFNNDGIPDLVVTSYYDQSVSVLLGNRDGTFQSPMNLTLPEGVFFPVVGDFNGDGNLDIAVTNRGDSVHTVYVLLGNGNGTFQPPRPYTAGTGPGTLAVGHFHDPNILDLVTSNSYSNDVSIFLGNGDGTFQDARSIPVANSPNAVAVGDFNGDGNLDIVTANGGPAQGSVSVLLGNGNGTFQQPAMDFLVNGNQPSSVAVADFNGDGYLDLVTSNASSGTVSVLLGNGDGSFQPPRLTFVGGQPYHLVVADFNLDRQQDIAVTTGASQGVALLYGKGDGSFQSPVYGIAQSTLATLAVGDFNADGYPDLAENPESTGMGVGVLLNVGNGTSPRGPSRRSKGSSPGVGHFPGDSFPGIAAASTTLAALPGSPATPTSVIPSDRALPPVLDVASLERFFAITTEKGHGSAWLRLQFRREAWLGADGGWLDDLGNDGWMVERASSADPSIEK